MPTNMAAEKILVSASAGVINSVLGKLANLIAKEFAMLKDVRKQALFLHDELGSMGSLLEDLEDMEGLNNQTKHWKNKVREMSYDIEDCLDDFTRRVGDPCDGKGLMRRLKTLRARHQLASQIQELKTRVGEAKERRNRYKLDECLSRSANVAIDHDRIPARYEDTSRLVGIDGPKEEVINLLTKKVNDESVQKLRVVSIVGFGGLGKTTLTNEVYKKLGESFHCKAFVSVSQKPDMMALLMSLARQILGQGVDDTHDLTGLIDTLRNYLRHERYLVVVDDLWDASKWGIIKSALPEGHYGSKVLTTTRDKWLAETCCNFQEEFVYRMKPLDDHNSKQLFYLRVFGFGKTCPQQFEGPSEKILKKCGGLPLAIISIASLLASQSKKSVAQWNYVLNSLRSDLSSDPLEGMRQILNLSYTYLPPRLKTCLLYIGMYPEDHDISKDQLVMQWVAEGFVNGSDGRDVLEIAESYLNELINRSMLIQVVKDNIWSMGENSENMLCKVHDMVLSLIVSKSAEENFLGVEEVSLNAITTRRQCKARRLSLQLHGSRLYDTIVPYSWSLPHNGSGLDKNAGSLILPHTRSLFTFGLPFLGSLQLLELKFLRVLFVWNVHRLDLTAIGKLFQLRYLYVEPNTIWSATIQLPRQICGLRHLETLNINGGVSHIPDDIVHLPALSYLKVFDKPYPDGIINMKSLRTLEAFNACTQSVDNLRGLGELLNLKELEIHLNDKRFCTKETYKDALFSSMEKLINRNLRHLTVDAYFSGIGSDDRWNSLSLSGCNLEQLYLKLVFPRLPVWISQLNALTTLEIRFDELCKDDIAVLAGLPTLTSLHLWVVQVPAEGFVFGNGMFGALCYFKSSGREYGSCPAFRIEAGAMPKLETLCLQMHLRDVKTCGVRLAGIGHLPNLKKVEIFLFHSLNEEPEVPTIKAAVKSFFDEHHHPRRPTIHIPVGAWYYHDY